MNEYGKAFVLGLSFEFIDPPIIRKSDESQGPTRTLDEWRTELVKRRSKILGTPGLYLDRSQTGAGKSTADLEAVRKVKRALIVAPTHENCEEIEVQMVAAGIDAKKFPARTTREAESVRENCWNKLADDCEQIGLSVVAAVCPSCRFREQCLQLGYLAEIERAKQAAVAIATHSRAMHNRLDRLAEGRGELISIHEDAANTLCPRMKLTEGDLLAAADVLERGFKNPTWHEWLERAACTNENGGPTTDAMLAEKRNQLEEFVDKLASVIQILLDQLQSAEQTQQIQLPTPVKKAIGIESLLLRASLQRKVKFDESPWRFLMAILTGEVYSLGVIIDERKSDRTTSFPTSASVSGWNL